MKAALIKGEFLIEKFEGKSAWHFVRLPLELRKNSPFGWLQVKGKINTYQFNQYKLMPMGNGFLFLPLKKEVRKLLNVSEGS